MKSPISERFIQKSEPIGNSPPEIGKVYDVPCVKASNPIFFFEPDHYKFAEKTRNIHLFYEKMMYRGLLWYPSYDDIHEDTKYREGTISHIHIDTRFLWVPKEFESLNYSGVIIYHRIEERAVKKLRCFRNVLQDIPYTPTQILTKKFQEDFEGISLRKKCLRCPHHNFDLSSMPIVNGQVTCPQHGLTFRIKEEQTPGCTA